MTIQRIDVNHKKYTIIFDESTGKLSALRYNEPWRDLTGDKLIYWLAMELQEARDRIDELKYITMEQHNKHRYSEK